MSEFEIDDPAHIAAVLDRFAAMLAAGCDASTAWGVAAGAARSDAHRRLATLLAEAAARHEPVALVIESSVPEGSCWLAVSAMLRLAARWGAPVAEGARALAAALRDRAEAARAVRTALAGPAATARLLAWLPWATALGALALGANTVGVYASPGGVALVAVGALLAVAYRRWTARILRRARPPDAVAGIRRELAAALLAAGVPAAAALEEARAAVPAAWLDAERAERGAGTADADVLATADTGAPVAGVLRADADDERRRARANGIAAAERAGVRLMLPLGLCLLPSFVVIGIVPLVIALLA